ncbi:hypothetical protein [Streptomyces echinatus]|uniref:Bacterial Ig domain-containing protein n=1 Tax=Streptomyces echinatus TaxID=67293 RepID=A0A7W9PNW1_9ACTN|nr:hypothetical protein [Streptomyces echinatus]MBB5925106.1 hypothetical protein [Streptomyces echinatus]
MTSVLRHRYGRVLGSGILCAALLSGGTAGAFAASPSPTDNGSASPTGDKSPTGTASPSPTGKTSITVTAGKSSVKAGDMVTFTGRTKGLKVGSPLVLQHEKNGKWTALKATAKVKTGNSYALAAKLNTKGDEHLRVASVTKEGKVFSPTVTVKVN